MWAKKSWSSGVRAGTWGFPATKRVPKNRFPGCGALGGCAGRLGAAPRIGAPGPLAGGAAGGALSGRLVARFVGQKNLGFWGTRGYLGVSSDRKGPKGQVSRLRRPGGLRGALGGCAKGWFCQGLWRGVLQVVRFLGVFGGPVCGPKKAGVLGYARVPGGFRPPNGSQRTGFPAAVPWAAARGAWVLRQGLVRRGLWRGVLQVVRYPGVWWPGL